jgi:hypothetical protein
VEELVGQLAVAHHVGALEGAAMESEGQRVLALPGVGGEQGDPASGVGQRLRERRGAPGAHGRALVEGGQRQPLGGIGDQLGPAIELAHHQEEVIVGRGAAGVPQETAAHLQVRGRPLRLVEQRVGRLLDAIVRELEGGPGIGRAARPLDGQEQPRGHRAPQGRARGRDVAPAGRRQEAQRHLVAQARRALEHLLGARRQPPQRREEQDRPRCR